MKSQPIRIQPQLEALQFLSNRTPETTDEEAAPAFAELSEYRNGGIYVGHYAGKSEWERHPHGDEIVHILEGATRLFLLIDGEEKGYDLSAGELLVVPENVWHRFETPKGVKVLTVTPQPTDHQVERPE